MSNFQHYAFAFMALHTHLLSRVTGIDSTESQTKVLHFNKNDSRCSDDRHFYINTTKKNNLSWSKITENSLSLNVLEISSKRLLAAFPLDPARDDSVRTVKNCVFSVAQPTPLKGPLKVAAVSKEVLEDILDWDVSAAETDDFIHFLSGGKLLPGSIPLAHRYGGHQFGVWAGQLGDGRAHLLGEYINRHGERWEIQLKGSGKTPYSRNGDGRTVIRSSLREFLCSEVMHYLGIPTSRAASLIVSNEVVWRDQFYNGHVKKEKGAIVARVAKSWFRIGSLEILASFGEIDLLRKLLNFVIDEHFPSVHASDSDKYLDFFSRVVTDTANLIALWMSVGFAHGVCNTDNFSLLSITIDYGPFGFMESYNPNFVPNTSDDEGRYKIGNQANTGMYNLDKLREALNPVLDTSQQLSAMQILKGYPDIYNKRFQELFKSKLGFLGEDAGDAYLIAYLLKLMEDTQADFTMTFRLLSEISVQQLQDQSIPQEFWALQDLSSHKLFSDWVPMYLLRLKRNASDSDKERRRRMKRINPRYILRNWMAESAVRKAERSDFSEVHLLQRVLSAPFHKQTEAEEAGYASRPPTWAEDLRVSCSS
ncbi:protein adenylyltransferase SelO-like isoform X1 [Acipenser oxyrinchus oxyrinchus]|uniref:Selenoprotein O n=1 Tax=Acipenser oxyrinchus oxyrinchus TaxID=40147 RepID=A0AAD8GCU9_ACIOX|nr:protein adenylyltransferase SelO-like isoform X1 [Acipenser oxyrinchus oxyrinchus]